MKSKKKVFVIVKNVSDRSVINNGEWGDYSVEKTSSEVVELYDNELEACSRLDKLNREKLYNYEVRYSMRCYNVLIRRKNKFQSDDVFICIGDQGVARIPGTKGYIDFERMAVEKYIEDAEVKRVNFEYEKNKKEKN